MEEKIRQVLENPKLHQVMEKLIQEVLKKQQVSANQIPRELVNEILNRLPLKSLARCKCVTKLWSILIDFILLQRLAEEIKWRVGKFTEAKQTLNAVMDELNGRVVDVDELRACHVRVKAKVDEMLIVADFDQDFLNCYPENATDFRNCVNNWVRKAEEFLRNIDAALNISLPLQDILRKLLVHD